MLTYRWRVVGAINGEGSDRDDEIVRYQSGCQAAGRLGATHQGIMQARAAWQTGRESVDCPGL